MKKQKYSSEIFFNGCFDKGELKNLIAWFLEKYGEKSTIDFLETLKDIGFHQATLAGVSLGLDDLKISEQKSKLISEALVDIQVLKQKNTAGNITSVEKSQHMIDTWNQTSDILRQIAVQNFRNTNPLNPVYMMAFSGARGNISQVRQLVAMRGLMADPQGAILEFPIQSNFREGLTITEYLISCYGARNGLVDTALRTATSGYLTRRLVDAVQHVVITLIDCGTKKGILLQDKSLNSRGFTERLIGRVVVDKIVLSSKQCIQKNELISPCLAKCLTSEFHKIVVRSPLTCEAEKSVCQLCYGWNLAHGKLVSIGEAVGVIAAQSIGEPGTQLTMRTFHTGGVGVFSDQAMKVFTAPFEGKIDFLVKFPGLFVRTPHGQIVYMFKYSSFQPERVILILKNKHNVYSLKEDDLPTGSILWVKQGEVLKAGQLIAQCSQIKTSKQQMPESTHPVQSPLDGEVYFENMTLSNQKQVDFKLKKRKRKEQETGPTSRSLIQLGNFWIFGSYTQKEFHLAKSFLRPGDLVSTNTPLFQYNLHISKKGELRKIRTEISIGQAYFHLETSETRFYKLGYFGVLKANTENHMLMNHKKNNRTKGKKKNENVIFYRKPTNKIDQFFSLIWYPKLLSLKLSGYCFISTNYFDISIIQQPTIEIDKTFVFEKNKDLLSVNSENKHFLSVENVKESIETQNPKSSISHSCLSTDKIENRFSGWSRGILFLFQQTISFGKNFHFTEKIFLVKKNLKKSLALPSSFQTERHKFFEKVFIFNKNQQFFTRTGLFQLQINTLGKEIHKNQKCFSLFFLKNRNNGIYSKYSLNLKLQSLKIANTASFYKIQSSFLDQSLKRVGVGVFDSSTILLGHKKSWIFISKAKTQELKSYVQFYPIILEPGKDLDQISFSKISISLSFITSQNLKFVNSKNFPNHENKVWYDFHQFISCKAVNDIFVFTEIRESNKKRLFENEIFHQKRGCSFQNLIGSKKYDRNFVKKLEKNFVFYRIKNEYNYRAHSQILKPFPKPHRGQKRVGLFVVGRVFEYSLPQKTAVTGNWFLNPAPDLNENLEFHSPILTKQNVTTYRTKSTPSLNFSIETPIFSTWMTSKLLSRVHVTVSIEEKSHFKSFHTNLKFWKSTFWFNTPLHGLILFPYDGFLLTSISNLRFQTFLKNSVISETSITRGFIKLKQGGEFKRLKTTQNESISSILQNKDFVTFEFPETRRAKQWSQKNLKIGLLVRCGEKMIESFGSCSSGQIVKLNRHSITLRVGIPFLASARGILHVFHNDLIQKNQLLITLKSRRLQTEDIVQGIPKIEQLFEARETQGGEFLTNNVQIKLQQFFLNALEFEELESAVVESVKNIQAFLIQNIIEAYSNQGVKISEKHVEIIVRQMTTRVRILTGGDTGLLMGELVQLNRIQQLNKQIRVLGYREATYEPIVLGITKSVLQSESFLLAASFQEVSRVLVRSALSKKTDFLRGLHENVILGQLVPAGTGLLADGISSFNEFSPIKFKWSP